MYRLYGIPNCDTVKKARTFLDKHKIPYEFVDFKKTVPEIKDLERWKKAFGDFPVNTKGVTYKNHKDEFLKLKDDKKNIFIQSHTSMIKRPILEKGSTVLTFGFSEDEFKTKLGL